MKTIEKNLPRHQSLLTWPTVVIYSFTYVIQDLKDWRKIKYFFKVKVGASLASIKVFHIDNTE